MKARILIALCLGAVAALSFSACGDDDDGGDTTPVDAAVDTEYLEALASALQSVNSQLEAIDELRAEAFADGPDPDAADAYGAAYETFAKERLAAIEALTPDRSMAVEHSVLVSAADEVAIFAEFLHAELNASPPANESEFRAVFDRLDGASFNDRFREICTAIEDRGTAAGLEIDLECLP